MKVLDLYSGLGGWSEAFVQHGHNVLRLDNDQRFADVPRTIIADVLEFEPRHDYDVVLASPPCQAFSLAATGTHMFAKTRCRYEDCGCVLVKRSERWVPDEHWTGFNEGCVHRPSKNIWLEPRTEFGKLSVRLVERALEIVELVKPQWWWMENPNGGMVHFVPKEIPRTMITFCAYGENRMKLWNIWGRWPDTWTPRPRCKNGDPCHEAAPRGAKTGTQGIAGAALRAKVPYELSEEVCVAFERAML